jgi:hypothetical protein
MKLRDFIKRLEEFDPDLEVYVACEGYGNLVKSKKQDVSIQGYIENMGDKQKPILAIISE